MLRITNIIGDDGDHEWLCPHGVGHSLALHTCDGCCGTDPRFQLWLNEQSKRRPNGKQTKLPA